MPDSPSTHDHKAAAPVSVNFAVMVISTGVVAGTRSDRTGNLIREKISAAGHRVLDSAAVPDDSTRIRHTILEFITNHEIQAIVTTGGTGLTKTDITVETVKPLFTRELPGFHALFTHLSYAAIGPACILSRATAGVISNSVVLFALPGSPDACDLALDKIILPEIAHIVKHVHDR